MYLNDKNLHQILLPSIIGVLHILYPMASKSISKCDFHTPSIQLFSLLICLVLVMKRCMLYTMIVIISHEKE